MMHEKTKIQYLFAFHASSWKMECIEKAENDNRIKKYKLF